MFIKVKLEYKNKLSEDDSNLKDSTFLEFSGSSTIRDVKEKLEYIVDICADEQIIKTLEKSYYDNEKLSDVCVVKEGGMDGSSLMLYYYEEFVCFLQLYNDEEAKKQQKFEEMSRDPDFYKNIPSCTSSVTLVGDSESNESDSSDSSDSSSEDFDTSSSDTDGKIIRTKAKRKVDQRSEQARDRIAPLCTKRIGLMLDQQPNYTEKIVSSSTPVKAAQTSSPVRNDKKRPASLSVPESETKRSRESNEKSKTSPTNPSSTTNLNEKLKMRPCASIAPEFRQFIVVVTSKNGNFDKEESISFIKAFYERFKKSNCANVNFDDNVPIVLHSDGKFWISCKDEVTVKWTQEKGESLENVKCVEKLVEHEKFFSYSVVMPTIQDSSKGLKEVFSLFENQNAGLNTSEWMVEKKRLITDDNDEFFDRSVSCLCSNEIIFLKIDANSEQYLKKLNFQIKYCFWKLNFKLQ